MGTTGEISVEVQWIDVKKELNLVTFIDEVQVSDTTYENGSGRRHIDVGHLKLLAPSLDTYIAQIQQGPNGASSSSQQGASGSSSQQGVGSADPTNGVDQLLADHLMGMELD